MITAKNLKVGYKHKQVINIESLDIPSGSSCVVTGASGSGKTTLMYALAGLSEVQAGSVFIQNQDIYAMPEVARDQFRGKHIGIVFQTLHLMTSLTVLENVLLAQAMINQRQDISLAEALLQEVDILDLKDRPANAISQGQAQRVALARALINKPYILLADEPTSSLDDDAASAILSLLHKARKEFGVTLVVTSHDSRIKNSFDQIVHLKGAA